MPAVDRNVLRLGVFELMWADDVPDAVAVTEAMALVRDLSTDESPGFVNGILGNILRSKPTCLRWLRLPPTRIGAHEADQSDWVDHGDPGRARRLRRRPPRSWAGWPCSSPWATKRDASQHGRPAPARGAAARPGPDLAGRDRHGPARALAAARARRRAPRRGRRRAVAQARRGRPEGRSSTAPSRCSAFYAWRIGRRGRGVGLDTTRPKLMSLPSASWLVGAVGLGIMGYGG